MTGERTSLSPAHRFVLLHLLCSLGGRAHDREAVADQQADDDPHDQADDQPGPLAPELHLEASAVEVRHHEADLGLAAGLRLCERRLRDLELGADLGDLGQVARDHEGLVTPDHGQEHDDDATDADRHVNERRAAHQRQANQGEGDGDAEHAVALEQGLAGAVGGAVADVGHQLAPEPEPEVGHVDQHPQKDIVQHARVDRPEGLRQTCHQLAGDVHQVEHLLECPLRGDQGHQDQDHDGADDQRVPQQKSAETAADCFFSHGELPPMICERTVRYLYHNINL